MRPRDEQNVSKLQGRTYENGKYWNEEFPIVTNIVAFPSKMVSSQYKCKNTLTRTDSKN
jgi:hypothetical protein